MARTCKYYDVRFLLLPLASHLQTYFDAEKSMSISNMVLMAVLLACCLFTTIRIQLFRQASSNGRRFVRCHGGAAISFPFIFSLLITLFLPPSSFWTAYFPIMLMSFWSDFVHAFVTRYSYQEERQLLLPVIAPTSPLHAGSGESRNS